jgi:hypothetical protein
VRGGGGGGAARGGAAPRGARRPRRGGRPAGQAGPKGGRPRTSGVVVAARQVGADELAVVEVRVLAPPARLVGADAVPVGQLPGLLRLVELQGQAQHVAKVLAALGGGDGRVAVLVGAALARRPRVRLGRARLVRRLADARQLVGVLGGGRAGHQLRAGAGVRGRGVGGGLRWRGAAAAKNRHGAAAAGAAAAARRPAAPKPRVRSLRAKSDRIQGRGAAARAPRHASPATRGRGASAMAQKASYVLTTSSASAAAQKRALIESVDRSAGRVLDQALWIRPYRI